VLKKSFRGEIFLYYIFLFILFTIAILAFQFEREKSYRISQLESTLDNITEITYRFVEKNQLIENNKIERINEITSIIPQTNVRITVINKNGEVIFDSFVEEYDQMENHLSRPEIQKSIQHKSGSNVRRSATTKQDYYYYAKSFPEFFVRTAVVYNLELQNFLRANLFFLGFIFVAFTIIGIVLYLVTIRLSVVITKLKDFAIRAGKNEYIDFNAKFPENELGVISRQIIQIYYNLKKAKDDLSNEKDKLFNHLNALNEGIAFFSKKKKCTLSNRHFIQRINIISKKSVGDPAEIFHLKEFRKLNNFLKEFLKSDNPVNAENLPQLDYTIV
jgi:two-component system phosphate regulon sensor histidine kinase PhoR